MAFSPTSYCGVDKTYSCSGTVKLSRLQTRARFVVTVRIDSITIRDYRGCVAGLTSAPMCGMNLRTVSMPGLGLWPSLMRQSVEKLTPDVFASAWSCE